MALTSISVICTVWVLKLHNNGPYHIKVPTWMKFIVFKCLARILRCNCDKRSHMEWANRQSKKYAKRLATHEGSDICLHLMNGTQTHTAGNNTYGNSPTRATMHARSRERSRVTDSQYADSELHQQQQVSFSSANHLNDSQAYRLKSRLNSSVIHPKLQHHASMESTHIYATPQQTRIETLELERLAILEDILDHLKQFAAKRERDDGDDANTSEWRHVAQIIDRFFFWLFLFITVVATLLILVLTPLMRYYY